MTETTANKISEQNGGILCTKLRTLCTGLLESSLSSAKKTLRTALKTIRVSEIVNAVSFFCKF